MRNDLTSPPAGSSAASSVTSEPAYAFLVLDRLRDRLPQPGGRQHYVELSEREIVALRGFEFSAADRDPDSRFLPRPLVGAILDEEFVRTYPDVVIRLGQLAPEVPGTDATYNLSAGSAGLLDWQLSRAFGLSSRFLSDLGSSQIEIARLQHIVHDHMEALQEAQRFVEQSVPPQPKLCVFLPPSGATLRLADAPAQGIRQGSKREFRAVHAFELHLADVEAGSAGSLVVTLEAAHSRQLLGTWTVPASTLDVGWNRFDAPFTARPLDEPVVIGITWEQGSAPGLSLGLGEITADPRLGYVRPDGTAAERSLALRMYEGAPGLRLPFHGWGRRADGDADDDAQGGAVVLDELLQRAQYFGGLSKPQPELLRFIDESTGLLLHPAGKTAHVAVIPNLWMDGVRAVVADVALDHQAAAATEFGLLVAPAGELAPRAASRSNQGPKWLRQAQAVLSGGGDPADAFLHGAAWLRLEGRERGQVTFEPPAPLRGRFDILLATRKAGSTTDHAWAHFVHLAAVRDPSQA